MTRSWTGIPELKESYRMLGPVRFSLLMFGTLVYVGIGAWLTIKTNHPRAAGSTCQRKCMIESYWYSPHLLSGGPIELLTFVWLWLLPATIPAAFIYAFVTKRGIFKKN